MLLNGLAKLDAMFIRHNLEFPSASGALGSEKGHIVIQHSDAAHLTKGVAAGVCDWPLFLLVKVLHAYAALKK